MNETLALISWVIVAIAITLLFSLFYVIGRAMEKSRKENERKDREYKQQIFDEELEEAIREKEHVNKKGERGWF